MSDSFVVGNASDVGELYLAQAARLEQLVRSDVRAPKPVIEDACQFAWTRLIHHGGRVRRESAVAWLTTTAIHEALRLIRRADRELSLDAAFEQLGDAGLRSKARAKTRRPSPAERRRRKRGRAR